MQFLFVVFVSMCSVEPYLWGERLANNEPNSTCYKTNVFSVIMLMRDFTNLQASVDLANGN